MIHYIGLITLTNQFINNYLNKKIGIYYLIPDNKLTNMLINLGFKKIITDYKEKELIYYVKTLNQKNIEWNTIINEL